MAIKREVLEFGAWEPDAPLLAGRQVSEARNVIPGRRGYRCLRGLAAMQYEAIPEPVRAAVTLRILDGGLFTFAATEGGIYCLEAGEWVQKLTATVSGSSRAFSDYGNAMYALFGTTLYKSLLSGTAGEFSAVEGAPNAAIMGVIRDFLVLGRLSEHANGIRWSALDNPDAWPEPGSNDAQYQQSDIQIFPVGGQVQSIVGGMGGVDGLIFLERGIQRATYVGPPYIFQFTPVDRASGCAAPASPVICGNLCVYLSENGWRMTDGASVKSVGIERIDEWFLSQVDASRMSEVRGVHDADGRVAVWSFPSAVAPEGIHDRLLIYNYAVDKWSYGMVQTETLFQDFARGLTLEELDAFGDLDHLPFSSLDDAVLRNGRQGISAFDSQHRLARFSGEALEAVMDTAETGGQRMMIHGLRPLVDRGDAQALPIWRVRQQDAPRYGTYTKQSRDGVCYQHLSASYAAGRVLVPAGATWRDAVGVELLTELEGGL